MSKRRNEVEAAMHSVVHYVSSIQPTLIMEVSFKLIVDILDDGLKTEIKYRTSHPPKKHLSAPVRNLLVLIHNLFSLQVRFSHTQRAA